MHLTVIIPTCRRPEFLARALASVLVQDWQQIIVVLALLGFQFALGLADILLLAPVWMQILHLLGADLYWVALVTLAAMVIWPNTGATSLRQADHSSL